MLETTIKAMTVQYGEPTRVRKKVAAWNVTAHLGVVVQLDSPSYGKDVHVWLPHFSHAKEVPQNTISYPADKGRHSGTYASPELQKGKPALRVTVKTNSELTGLISYINALRQFKA
jgi:hypothetical protein